MYTIRLIDVKKNFMKINNTKYRRYRKDNRRRSNSLEEINRILCDYIKRKKWMKSENIMQLKLIL